MKENILLLEASLKYPKKWSKLSSLLVGRNQHSVKNHFIALISKEFSLSWKKTKTIMKKDGLENLIKKTLESLNAG